MTNRPPHARTSDLPGWPCPPRVRDMPKTPKSWGYVPIGSFHSIVQDEQGYLWADGDRVPMPIHNGEASYALLVWTEQGLAVFIDPRGYGRLPFRSLLDDEPERWIPIVAVLAEPPTDVKKFA